MSEYIREVRVQYVGQRRKTERIQSSRHVARLLAKVLPRSPQEHFVVIALDAKNTPVAWYTAAIGVETMALVTPGIVYRSALLVGAAGVILAHNHPSGDSAPSPDDIELTTRLSAAGILLGIRVIDHIITGEGDYFSFLDAGLIKPERGNL